MKKTLLIAAVALLAMLSSCYSGTGTKGPFNTHCLISPKGVAALDFWNTGGRTQHLRSFTLTLKHGTTRLRSRHIVITPPYKVPPQNALATSGHVHFTEAVTYRATSCGIAKVRR